MVAAKIAYAEVMLAEGSPLVGELVRHAGFRSRFNIGVVGIYRRNNYRLTNLAYMPLRAGDRILVQGEIDDVEDLDKFADFDEARMLADEALTEQYNTDERMFVVRLPKYSDLADATLEKSRLADVFDFRVVAIFRDGKLKVMPRGGEVLEGGDLLLIEGQHEDLDVLRGLQELEVEEKVAPNLGALESERLTLMDATLDPRSSLAGKTVGELNFRERYGIELAGIWREGGPIGVDLADRSHTVDRIDHRLFVLADEHHEIAELMGTVEHGGRRTGRKALLDDHDRVGPDRYVAAVPRIGEVDRRGRRLVVSMGDE